MAVQFQGGHGAVLFGHTGYESWLNAGALTVEALIQPSTISAGVQTIVERDYNGSAGVSGKAWQMQLSDGYPTFYFYPTATLQSSAESTSQCVAGTTYHIVATYDGSSAKMYVNGSLAGSVAIAGQMAQPATQGLTLGNTDASTAPFDGILENIAIYPRALTSAQVSAHWAAVFPAATTPTVTGSASTSAASTALSVTNDSFFLAPR